VGHKAFHPGHPSLTYFGLMGLTASGIGALFGGPSVAMRSVGFVAVCAALLGTAHYGSRTCLVSGIFAVASSAIFTTTKHRFSWTIALCGALVAGTGIMAFFLSDAWDRTRIQYLQARQAGHDSIGDWAVSTYRSTSSSRDVLHAWTLDRVRQAPIVGHGARTWRAEFKASDSQSDHQLAGGAETWRSLRSNVSEAHSLYLEVLHDYGAIGLAMLLCLLVSLAVPPWMSRFGVRSVAAIAFLSSACAMGVYEGTLNSRPMIGFLAIILALAATGLSSGSRTERP
jgi:O-antigen ligase